MKISVLLILMLISGLTGAQSNMYKQYSSNGYDFGQGVVELPDSSYVITGASSSFTDGPSQMFLLKVDSLGEYVWSHHYGGIETDWGVRVKHIENLGFFVGGYTNSSGNGAYDFALWKIDETGTEEWFRTYGTSGWERVHDMALTADSGIILVGETNTTDDGFTDIYIVRTDQNGTILWEQQIENPGDDNALTIKQYDDSTFVIGGYYYNSTTNLKQAWLARIEDDGTEIWSSIWGNNYDFDAASIEMYNNLVYGVGSASLETGESYLFVFKIDGVNGSIVTSEHITTDGFRGVGITTHLAPDLFSICTDYFVPGISYGYEDLYFYGYTSNPYYYGNLGTIKYQTSQKLGQMITSYNYSTVAVGYNENIGPGGSSIFIFRKGSNQPIYEVYDDFSTESLVSITELLNTDNLIVYPNPADDHIFISSEKLKGNNFLIQLFDLSGKEVIQLTTDNLNQAQIDVSEIDTGIYTLIIKDHTGIQLTKKIGIK